jgi:integrase/recombinase XerD
LKYQSLFGLVQRFFLIYLRSTRGLSENTICSYRDTLRIFLAFAATKLRKKTHRLELSDFTADVVLSFLEHTEQSRGNKARTRNHRLALLRSFFAYLLNNDEERAGNYEKILQIPWKVEAHRPIQPLEPKEIESIFNCLPRKPGKGLRDHILLLLMYNTGARVQEICDLRMESFSLDGDSPSVTIVGKGKKTRVVPLWEKTCRILNEYLEDRRRNTTEPIFTNYQGTPLTRFGVAVILRRRTAMAAKICPSIKNKRVSPHVIRHTTATHLLQSGVDLTVIRAWLGHVNLETTTQYVDIDMKMKQAALSKKKPPKLRRELQKVIDKNKDIVAWLKNLE